MGFMKYAVEMGSGAVKYIPSSIKTGSGIQKLTGGNAQTHRHRQHGDLISILTFFQNKKSKLKTGGLQFAVHEVSALFATSYYLFVFRITAYTNLLLTDPINSRDVTLQTAILVLSSLLYVYRTENVSNKNY
jgi:hypothetical protein